MGCNDFSFYSTLPKSRTYNDSVHTCKFLTYILFVYLFAIDKCCLDFIIIIGPGLRQTFQNTLISILKVIFADKTDVYNLGCLVSALKERAPWAKGRGFTYWLTHFPQDCLVEFLFLHTYRNLVYRWHVYALNNGIEINVTEIRNLFAYAVINWVLCSQDKNIGLYTYALQFFYRMLCRFCLQFFCRSEIWYISKVHAQSSFAELPFQLAYALQKR